MKYYAEKSLENFKPWSGAVARLEELKQHEEAFNHISDLLDEITSENELSDSEINDFLWFELDQELEEAGYYCNDNDEWYEDGSFNNTERDLDDFKPLSNYTKQRINELKEHPDAYDEISSYVYGKYDRDMEAFFETNEMYTVLENAGYYDTESGKWYDDGDFNAEER